MGLCESFPIRVSTDYFNVVGFLIKNKPKLAKNNSMSDTNKNLPSEEEKAEEVKAQVAPKEEDVRTNIISEYGFNETEDVDKIDKLVEKELDSAKKLSSAIGQKIKNRDKVAELEEQLKDKAPEPKKDDVKIDTENLDKTLDDKVTASLEKRDLDSLEYSDDVKKEIQRVANIRQISIKEALRDPYITSKVEDYEKEQKTDEASISRTNNRGGKKSVSLDNPPEVDMGTEEGRKEWEDYKKAMIKAGN